MATFFTSDHHFGHANIIRYCNRPYASVGDMNFDLTRRWNAIVTPDDTVWYLGDFAMGEPAAWPMFLAGLNGTIHLVQGNHDKPHGAVLATGFASMTDNLIIEADGYRLWLNHYPPTLAVEEPYRNAKHQRPAPPGPYDIALCGHVHEKWTVFDNMVNVGVDRWEFQPIGIPHILNALDAHHAPPIQ